MCASVRASCAPVLLCQGQPWPASLDCDRFPGDEDTCLAPLSKDYKHLHKGSSGWGGRVAMPRVPGTLFPGQTPCGSVTAARCGCPAPVCVRRGRVPALHCKLRRTPGLESEGAVLRQCRKAPPPCTALGTAIHRAHHAGIALRSLYRLVNGP